MYYLSGPNSRVHCAYVSVPGSVADTHNSSRLISKTIHLLLMGETWYMVRVYMAWATGLLSYIRVLRYRSYVNVAPFLQATWSADATLDLSHKRNPISQCRIPSVALSNGSIFEYTPGVLSGHVLL